MTAIAARSEALRSSARNIAVPARITFGNLHYLEYEMTKESESDRKAEQDTPGRPDSSASRQQTHPGQGTQTGSPAIDADSKNTAKPKQPSDLNSRPDRSASGS